MLLKFESRSQRVKGLSFHPQRPWILASLHTGSIHLYDYSRGALLEKFEEHEGPVRGVDFHSTQPLFVSGGDDYKIKVWNYNLKRCWFSLLGHLDYIRTVQFHQNYPWIVSASDDQTIRIWNWQSRTCISVLTGHNHYVMCAQFHPTEDLVASASLDQTVRVWDVSGLRKKTVRSGAPDEASAARANNDIFGSSDAVVKYVLEGHDRGVNWVAFHPVMPLLASAADDRSVKMWRMNDTKAWEVDTLRGHTNNVSCVVFHPNGELLISDSEDRSIRVWDMTKRVGVQTLRKENDRFWILCKHPSQDLLAAGHDSGMIVMKLRRERPPATRLGDHVVYAKDKYLRMYTLSTAHDVPIVSVSRACKPPAIMPRVVLLNPWNREQTCLLALSEADGVLELIKLPPLDELGTKRDVPQVVSGRAHAVAFTSRSRFAVLAPDRTNLVIRDLDNESRALMQLPIAVDFITQGPLGRLVAVREESPVVLFDVGSRRVVGEVHVAHTRRVIWAPDYAHVALVCKSGVVVADRDFNYLFSVNESVRIKSGAWSAEGVFVYATINHFKYLLPTGEHGVLRSVHEPLYIVSLERDTLYCLDRTGKMRTVELDGTEYRFKQALAAKRYDEVLRIIRTSSLAGRAIIAFLQERGFPEVALHFVQDDKTRFELALQCGNVDVALAAAQALDSEAHWNQLAVEALRQGNLQVVEMAYQRTKSFERLSFLYLITGNTDKLRKMLQISTMLQDTMARFHNALYLGDVAERVRVLEQAGQLSLAYICATIHGLQDHAQRLQQLLEQAGAPLPALPASPALLAPPPPLLQNANWPRLTVAKSFFEGALAHADGAAGAGAGGGGGGGGVAAAGGAAAGGGGAGGASLAAAAAAGEDLPDASAAWAADDDLDLGLDEGGHGGRGAAGGAAAGAAAGAGGGGWAVDEDLDLDLGDVDVGGGGGGGAGAGAADAAGDGDVFAVASEGTPPGVAWTQSSSVAADHVAAGDFRSAMQLLSRQIGVVNFEPLRAHFLAVYSGAHTSLPGVPGVLPMSMPLLRGGGGGGVPLPAITVTLSSLVERLKLAYRAFQAGSFAEAKDLFMAILHAIPLVVVEKRTEVAEVKELLTICREYVTAVRLELERKEHKGDVVRMTELSAYLTHCRLQPMHLLLGLNLAMTCAYKAENFINAASFARRLLEMPEASTDKNEALRTKAKKVLTLSEKQARNANVLDYDERNPFEVCAATLRPIYRGTPSVTCPYCGAHHKPNFKGAQCSTCTLSQVGLETLGLVCSNVQRG